MNNSIKKTKIFSYCLSAVLAILFLGLYINDFTYIVAACDIDTQQRCCTDKCVNGSCQQECYCRNSCPDTSSVCDSCGGDDDLPDPVQYGYYCENYNCYSCKNDTSTGENTCPDDHGTIEVTRQACKDKCSRKYTCTCATPDTPKQCVQDDSADLSQTACCTCCGCCGGGHDPTPSFDFALSNNGDIVISRPIKAISDYVKGSNTITASLISGVSKSVNFSQSGLPSGVSAGSLSSCSPSCSKDNTLTISSSASLGKYLITVTSTGGGITRTTTYNLIIKDNNCAYIVCENGINVPKVGTIPCPFNTPCPNTSNCAYIVCENGINVPKIGTKPCPADTPCPDSPNCTYIVCENGINVFKIGTTNCPVDDICPTCTINSFTINKKDNSEQNPLLVWVNASLKGYFSVNDVCKTCIVSSNDTWGYTPQSYPITTINSSHTETFKIDTAGIYNYTLECVGADPEDVAIDNLSLQTVQAINLPWWREIIPVLTGFLRGVWE